MKKQNCNMVIPVPCDEYFKKIDTKLDGLDEKVDSLVNFKWWLIGIGATVTTCAGLVIQYISKGA